MTISRKVIIYLMTASVSILCVSGNKGGPVNIAFAEATPQSMTTSTSSPNTKNDPIIGMIAGGVVCSALFLILVIVLYRHKSPRTKVCCATGGSSEDKTNTGHNTEGYIREHHYDDIQMQNQQASLGEALPSVYATVNLPADQLLYASVSFQKDSTDGNALPVLSACDCSSISWPQGATHPPAAEQTLYSTVTYPKQP